MVGKEEVDHEHVSLLCSTQVGSPLISLCVTTSFIILIKQIVTYTINYKYTSIFTQNAFYFFVIICGHL